MRKYFPFIKISILGLVLFYSFASHATTKNSCLERTVQNLAPASEWLETIMTSSTFKFEEGMIDLKRYIATPEELSRANLPNADTIKRNPEFVRNWKTNFHDLDLAEAWALHIYTGLNYSRINRNFNTRTSASAIITSSKQMELEIKILASAINKIKQKYVGTVFRSVRYDRTFVDWLIQKKEMNQTIFSSSFWSSDEKFNNSEYQILYRIQSKTGVSITPLSMKDFEDEVLFSPGVPFRISAVAEDTNKTKTWIVDLEEVTQ